MVPSHNIFNCGFGMSSFTKLNESILKITKINSVCFYINFICIYIINVFVSKVF